MPTSTDQKIRVVILAGRRPEGDPVADMFGVPYKAAVKIGDKTMMDRVISSLDGSGCVDGIYILAQSPEELAAQPAFQRLANRPDIHFEKSDNSICGSLVSFLNRHPDPFPVLVTTSDHTLLQAQDILDFKAATPKDADISVGLIEDKILLAAHPTSKRTWLKFSNGSYTSCNLFLLQGPNAKNALVFWSHMEQFRKKVWKLAWKLGPMLFIRFLLGRLSLERVFSHVSKKLGSTIKPVKLNRAELSIDVDKPADVQLVKEILGC